MEPHAKAICVQNTRDILVWFKVWIDERSRLAGEFTAEEAHPQRV